MNRRVRYSISPERMLKQSLYNPIIVNTEKLMKEDTEDSFDVMLRKKHLEKDKIEMEPLDPKYDTIPYNDINAKNIFQDNRKIGPAETQLHEESSIFITNLAAYSTPYEPPKRNKNPKKTIRQPTPKNIERKIFTVGEPPAYMTSLKNKIIQDMDIQEGVKIQFVEEGRFEQPVFVDKGSFRSKVEFDKESGLQQIKMSKRDYEEIKKLQQVVFMKNLFSSYRKEKADIPRVAIQDFTNKQRIKEQKTNFCPKATKTDLNNILQDFSEKKHLREEVDWSQKFDPNSFQRFTIGQRSSIVLNNDPKVLFQLTDDIETCRRILTKSSKFDEIPSLINYNLRKDETPLINQNHNYYSKNLSPKREVATIYNKRSISNPRFNKYSSQEQLY